MKRTACVFLICLAVLSAISNGLFVNCSVSTGSASETAGSIEYAHVPGAKHYHAEGSHTCEIAVEASVCEHEVSSCVDKPLSSEFFQQSESLTINDLVTVGFYYSCLPDSDLAYTFNTSDDYNLRINLPDFVPDDLIALHISSTVILI